VPGRYPLSGGEGRREGTAEIGEGMLSTSVTEVLKIAGIVVAVAIALFLLDRFLLWCESRGWIYYRRSKASPGTAASAFLEMQAMLEPGKEHILKESKRVQEERDDEGEPPEPSSPR
jgi:hypothetical protein